MQQYPAIGGLLFNSRDRSGGIGIRSDTREGERGRAPSVPAVRAWRIRAMVIRPVVPVPTMHLPASIREGLSVSGTTPTRDRRAARIACSRFSLPGVAFWAFPYGWQSHVPACALDREVQKLGQLILSLSPQRWTLTQFVSGSHAQGQCLHFCLDDNQEPINRPSRDHAGQAQGGTLYP